MRNFHLLTSGAHVAPLVNALARNSHLWNRDRLRTTHAGTVHSEADDIWLRFNDLSEIMDSFESVNYPAMSELPQARPLIFDLMRLVEGERLGRVIVTRLPPGKAIAPHVDEGNYAAHHDRYQVILQCPVGCSFRAGTETVQMAAGNIWWFDTQAEHEVINLGQDDRLAMIVDIRTFR